VVQSVRVKITDSHGSDCIPREVIHFPLLPEAIDIDEVHADFTIVPRCRDAIAPEIHACSHCGLKHLLMHAEQRIKE
jgi:hypothetical protein